MTEKEMSIKIVKGGPYIVSGNVPLSEKAITPEGKGYVWTDLREIEHRETYSLCRCGKTQNAPFCDGAHTKAGFVGKEKAKNNLYNDRAKTKKGKDLDLKDDGRCAYARFCHREDGDAWTLVKKSDDPHLREEAIRAASECPTGRLLACDKDGKEHEDALPREIVVIQDPENNCGGGLYVKGGIPVISSEGEAYEVRNRQTLCRCGRSRDMPFCDGMHVRPVFGMQQR